jgi:hypothetical protein
LWKKYEKDYTHDGAVEEVLPPAAGYNYLK